MAEQGAQLSGTVRTDTDALVGGYLIQPFGDVTTYKMYIPETKTVKVIQLYQDGNGDFYKDPETGGFLTSGEVYEHKYLSDVKIIDRELPIKNFFSLGLTSAILKPEKEDLAATLIKASATQIELLTRDLEYGRQREIIKRVALLNKLYMLTGDLVDTSKGTGEMAHLLKSKFEHSISDFRQAQTIQEISAGKGPLSGILNKFRNPVKGRSPDFRDVRR